ncbi:MAG: hypothetical protein U5K00_06140 [Melioribacteraceae bacterium]|nr:hypothetical protein [Melioribacteraceae bacterium]
MVLPGKIVIPQKSDEPYLFMQMFFSSGTTIGSTTNDKGEYQISGVP